jgi:hypothetical protein
MPATKYPVCFSAFKRKRPCRCYILQPSLEYYYHFYKKFQCVVKLQAYFSSVYKNDAVFGIDQLRFIYSFEKCL